MVKVIGCYLYAILFIMICTQHAFADNSAIHAYNIWVGQWLQVEKSFLSGYTGPVMLRMGERGDVCFVTDNDRLEVYANNLSVNEVNHGAYTICFEKRVVGVSFTQNRICDYDSTKLTSVESVHMQFIPANHNIILKEMPRLLYILIDEFARCSDNIQLFGKMNALKGVFPLNTVEEFGVKGMTPLIFYTIGRMYVDSRPIMENGLFKNCLYLPLAFYDVDDLVSYYNDSRRNVVNAAIYECDKTIILPNHVETASFYFKGGKDRAICEIKEGSGLKYISMYGDFKSASSISDIVRGLKNSCNLEVIIVSGKGKYGASIWVIDENYAGIDKIPKNTFDVSALADLNKLKIASFESLGVITGFDGMCELGIESLYFADVGLCKSSSKTFMKLKSLNILRCWDVSAEFIANILASCKLESMNIMATEIKGEYLEMKCAGISRVRWIGCNIDDKYEIALLEHLSKDRSLEIIDISYSIVSACVNDRNIKFDCKMYAYYAEIDGVKSPVALCRDASHVVWTERGNVSYAGYEKEILKLYLAVNVLYCCAMWSILKIAYIYPRYVYAIDVEYLCF